MCGEGVSQSMHSSQGVDPGTFWNTWQVFTGIKKAKCTTWYTTLPGWNFPTSGCSLYGRSITEEWFLRCHPLLRRGWHLKNRNAPGNWEWLLNDNIIKQPFSYLHLIYPHSYQRLIPPRIPTRSDVICAFHGSLLSHQRHIPVVPHRFSVFKQNLGLV